VHVLAEQIVARLGSQESESDAKAQPLADRAHS